jgi:hypothetical protein
MSYYELLSYERWFDRKFGKPIWTDWNLERSLRLNLASADDIIQVTKEMWADPAMRKIYQRTGRYGNRTPQERKAVDAFLDSKHVGKHWTTSHWSFKLSEAIIRRHISGEFETLDNDKVRAFIAERNYNSGHGDSARLASPADVVDLAYCIANNADGMQLLRLPYTAETSRKHHEEQWRITAPVWTEGIYRGHFPKSHGLGEGTAESIAELLVCKVYAHLHDKLDGLDTPDTIAWLRGLTKKSDPGWFAFHARPGEDELAGYDRHGPLPFPLTDASNKQSDGDA